MKTTAFLAFTELETRLTPASALYNPTNGVLLIQTGGVDDDRVIVRQRDARVYVQGIRISSGGSTVDSILAGQIASIQINGTSKREYFDLASGKGYGEETITIPTTIYSGNGSDTILGGDGDDHLFGGDRCVSIYGRGGHDRINLTNGFANQTNINGGEGNDVITAYSPANLWLLGEGGDDTITGGRGNDWISGGSGRDQIYGADGNDVIDGGSEMDYLDGQAGNDYLAGGWGDDFLFGSAGMDTLFGGGNNDYLSGEDDADTLFGDDGTDTLYGGNGDDGLDGGAGFDRLIGGSGYDSFTCLDGIDLLDGERRDTTHFFN